MDDRHRVITLQGAGGVGKTSSALQVLNRLYEERRFEVIVWFSARDVDLLPDGPRTVEQSVLNLEDIARQYALMVLSAKKLAEKGLNQKGYLQGQLGECDGGNCLFVFDNFETVQNPVEMFKWIESFVNLPNKVLITTRLRDFKGDFPVEVSGMTASESRSLVDQTARHLRIQRLLNDAQVEEIVSQSGGHPYVIKILLGDIATLKKYRSPRHVVVGSGEILTALFERSFQALSPCAQRAFLTLSAWNSAVSRVALEAVLIRSTKERTEVENGVESLLKFSLAEARQSPEDGQEFVSLPLAASAFGKGKLQVNILKPAILSDVKILQLFSPIRLKDVNLSLAKGLESFFRNVARRLEGGESLTDYKDVLDMLCGAYNPGWLLMAQWHLEQGTDDDLEVALTNIKAFLERDQRGPDSSRAWRMLARVYYLKGDQLGEIHALVERSQNGSVPIEEVSSTATLLNRKYADLDLEADAKHQLARQLLEVLESRIEEVNSDDLSRMAWLALHLGQEQKAKTFANQGLQADPENPHCQRLIERLESETYR